MLPTRCYISHGAWCWGACSIAGGSALPALNRKRGRVNLISQKSKVRESKVQGIARMNEDRGRTSAPPAWGHTQQHPHLGLCFTAPCPPSVFY